MKIAKFTGITPDLSIKIRSLPRGPKPVVRGPQDAMDTSYVWETVFDELEKLICKPANLNVKN